MNVGKDFYGRTVNSSKIKIIDDPNVCKRLTCGMNKGGSCSSSMVARFCSSRRVR